MEKNPLPADVTAKLIAISNYIPDATKRSEFVANVTRKVSAFGSGNKHALLYGGAGFVLGEMIDSLVDTPFGTITGDLMSHFCALIGASVGAEKDEHRRNAKERMAEILREQLKLALS